MRNPPLEYLLACSEKSLQDFELNRLNHAANIRKQMQINQEEMRQADAEAALARWLMEHRAELLAAGAMTMLPVNCTCGSVKQIAQHSFEFVPPPAPPVSVTSTGMQVQSAGSDTKLLRKAVGA
jgi:hypothetical protein